MTITLEKTIEIITGLTEDEANRRVGEIAKALLELTGLEVMTPDEYAESRQNMKTAMSIVFNEEKEKEEAFSSLIFDLVRSGAHKISKNWVDKYTVALTYTDSERIIWRATYKYDKKDKFMTYQNIELVEVL